MQHPGTGRMLQVAKAEAFQFQRMEKFVFEREFPVIHC